MYWNPKQSTGECIILIYRESIHVHVYPMCMCIMSSYAIILRVSREYPMCMCIPYVLVLSHRTESIPCVCVFMSHVCLYCVTAYREYPMGICIPCVICISCVFVLCHHILRVSREYPMRMCVPSVCVSHVHLYCASSYREYPMCMCIPCVFGLCQYMLSY